MQNKVLSTLTIVALIGIAVFMFTRTSQKTNSENTDANPLPKISSEIIWNAYALNGTQFIYPAEWTFVEIKEPTNPQTVLGFKVTYPIGASTFDMVEVGGQCPVEPLAEIHNACINDIWIRTQSQNPVVLEAYENMVLFGETQN